MNLRSTPKTSKAKVAAPSLESMTGFGEHTATFLGTSYVCRARSVNHRFLELKIRFPRGDYMKLEALIRKHCSDQFKRGALDISVSQSSTGATTGSVELNAKLAESYFKQLKSLSKLTKSPITVDTLIRLPGVVSSGGAEDETLVKISAEQVFDKLILPALNALKTARQKEGASLRVHLVELQEELARSLSEIKILEPAEKAKAHEQIVSRIQDTLRLISSAQTAPTTDFSQFDSKLREEASYWIERKNFEEERVRFGIHVESLKQLIDSKDDSIGKKIEFLHQELLREVNTLGNKAQSTAISAHTLEIKATLERLKEQLANVV